MPSKVLTARQEALSRISSNNQLQTQYTVRPGDTLGSITAQHTANPNRYVDLILANPHRAQTVVNHKITFAKRLVPGEHLNLPASWGRSKGFGEVVYGIAAAKQIAFDAVGRSKGFAATDVNSAAQALITAYVADNGTTICTNTAALPNGGTGDPTVYAFQVSYNAQTTGQKLDEDGRYGPNTMSALTNTFGSAPPDCTNYTAPSTAMYTAGDLNVIAAEVAGDFTLCQGINSNVQAFQDAYNAATPGGTLGVSQDYGFYTAPTADALATVVGGAAFQANYSYLTAPGACTNFPNPAGPGSGGGTITPPPPPPYKPAPPYNPPATNTSSNGSMWLVALLAVAGGAGAVYYYKKHHAAAGPKAVGPRARLGTRVRGHLNRLRAKLTPHRQLGA